MVVCKYKFTVEIPVALIFFSFMFSASIGTNLVIFRTCYVTLGYNISECEKLGSNNKDNFTQKLEEIVQPYANMISMMSGILGQVVPSVISLFLGPWSDHNGRKPVMLAVLTGSLIGHIIMCILTFTTYVSPWFFILSSLPTIVTGGFTSFFTVVLCYVTDTSGVNERGVRMGVLDSFVTLGMLLGTLLSSYAFNEFGYIFIYVICANIMLIAVLYVYFLVPESVIIEEDREKNIFVFRHIRDIVRTTIKRRENFDRGLLYLVIIILVSFAILFTADGTISFMYLREKFGWDVQKYTLYESAKNVIGIIGTLSGVFILHKLLKIPEPILLILGFSNLIVGYLMMTFAQNDTQIYVAGIIRCIGGVITPMIRSVLSKLVPSEDIGKIFSLTVILETLIGIVGTPLYTFIYNSTIETLPGAYNLVTVAICAIDIIISIFIIVIRRIYYNYDQLEEVVDAIN